MRPIVFLGPSLPIDEAIKILDADYRPPVKRGDLLALPESTKVIGMIDGVLLTDAAVGHREIMTLLRSGVKIYGGSSMGALRASELSDFGMIGIGRVYEEYMSGRITGDDEVVLTYDPSTQRPISEPLVNIRLNLEDAVKNGTMSDTLSKEIISRIKMEYYPERNYSLLREIAKGVLDEGCYQKLDIFLGTKVQNYKQNDARLLLETIKADLSA